MRANTPFSTAGSQSRVENEGEICLAKGSVITPLAAKSQSGIRTPTKHVSEQLDGHNSALARIFPSQKGGAKGIRTPDPHTASVVRYQLRHSPVKSCWSTVHHCD